MIVSRKPNTIGKNLPIAIALSFILSACNNGSSKPEALGQSSELHGVWEKERSAM
jgi:hypothetical protein